MSEILGGGDGTQFIVGMIVGILVGALAMLGTR